jgi:hypothetical protein
VDWNAGFDHLPIIGSDRFGNFRGMNVKVGFAANLVTLNLMPAFKFAIH